jgi:hypothetical protein
MLSALAFEHSLSGFQHSLVASAFLTPDSCDCVSVPVVQVIGIVTVVLTVWNSGTILASCTS